MDADQVNFNGWNSLIFAIIGGKGGAPLLKYLLNICNNNHEDYYGKNPLHYAKQKGLDSEEYKLLKEKSG